MKIPLKLITKQLKKGEYKELEKFMRKNNGYLKTHFSDKCPFCERKFRNNKKKKITYIYMPPHIYEVVDGRLVKIA